MRGHLERGCRRRWAESLRGRKTSRHHRRRGRSGSSDRHVRICAPRAPTRRPQPARPRCSAGILAVEHRAHRVGRQSLRAGFRAHPCDRGAPDRHRRQLGRRSRRHAGGRTARPCGAPAARAPRCACPSGATHDADAPARRRSDSATIVAPPQAGARSSAQACRRRAGAAHGARDGSSEGGPRESCGSVDRVLERVQLTRLIAHPAEVELRRSKCDQRPWSARI